MNPLPSSGDVQTPRNLTSLFEACTTSSHLKQAHSHIITSGLTQNDATLAQLLRACALARPPDPCYARLLFDRVCAPNAFVWNNLFRAHSRTTNSNPTLCLYKELLLRGAKPKGITFAFVLKACVDLKRVAFLMGVHAHVLVLGFQSDSFVLNSLVHAYTACGSINSARTVFDELFVRDLIAWAVLLNGYVRVGRAKDAIDLFFFMIGENVRPDEVVFVAVFTACAQLGDLSLGRKVESLARKFGIRQNKFVVNCLINMYAKCGSIGDARKLFDRMEYKDIVSWNSMVAGYARVGNMEVAKSLFDQIPVKNEISWSALINGYVQNCCFKEALNVYRELRDAAVVLNEAAITLAIAACTHLGALDLGREIHLSLGENKIISDVILSTALVDMYVKCGCLEVGWALFDRILNKNVITWNVMIMGLAIHGKASECLQLFSRMLEDGLRPNSMTFVGILTACVHAGWLREAKDYFGKMTTVYGIAPCAEHYSCMVHLIGQAGLLAEAFKFIKASPVKPDAALWGALLSACRLHGHIGLGEVVANHILELDPCHSGACVQLSSMYATTSMWEEVLLVRRMMKDRGVKNHLGWSCFELNGTTHEFVVGVNTHPQYEEVHSILHGIGNHMIVEHSILTA